MKVRNIVILTLILVSAALLDIGRYIATQEEYEQITLMEFCNNTKVTQSQLIKRFSNRIKEFSYYKFERTTDIIIEEELYSIKVDVYVVKDTHGRIVYGANPSISSADEGTHRWVDSDRVKLSIKNYYLEVESLGTLIIYDIDTVKNKNVFPIKKNFIVKFKIY